MRAFTTLVAALACAAAASTATAAPRSPARAARPSKARELARGAVRVGADGSVRVAGRFAGKLPLPPPPRRLEVTRPRVGKRTLLHVRIRGRDGRAAELLLEGKRAIFSGPTGPRGVDGEWSRTLQVSSNSVLTYERRDGIERCDGAPVYLFPRLYDFKLRRFRLASRRPSLGTLPTLVATPTAPAGLRDAAAAPLGTWRAAVASTHLGDNQSAKNLAPPNEIDDGKRSTAWAEGLGTDGHGEFITARATPSPYRLRAVAIIPGDARSAAAWRKANRLKTAYLMLGRKQRFRVVFKRDPSARRYWVVLPRPVAASCATLLLDRVYRGSRASGRNGGRSAIAELRFFTDLSFGTGIASVVADLAHADAKRYGAAISVLARLGPRAAKLLAPQVAKAKAPLLRRIVRVLGRIGDASAAPLLVRALPRLDASGRALALDALAKLSRKALPSLLPLLAHKQPALRHAVAAAVARIGGPQARAALLGRVGQGDQADRKAVANALSLTVRDGDVATIVNAATAATAQPRTRADLLHVIGAASALLAAATRRSVAAQLRAKLGSERSFEVRYRLLRALGRLDATGQLPALLAASRDTDAVLRRVAVVQLAQVRAPAATRRLVAAVSDKHPPVRERAAMALKGRKGSGIDKALAAQLDRERWHAVLRALAEALGQHCTQVSVSALDRAIVSGPRGIAERALVSLVQCKPRGLFKRLIKIADNDRARLALRRRSLDSMPVDLARKHVNELVTFFTQQRRYALRYASEEAVAISATNALARAGTSRALRALADALAVGANATIRAACARALGRDCPAAAKTIVLRALGDSEDTVKRAAELTKKRCKW